MADEHVAELALKMSANWEVPKSVPFIPPVAVASRKVPWEAEDLGEGLGGGPEGLAHPYQLAGAGPGGMHRGRSRVHTDELPVLLGAGWPRISMS